MAARTLKGNHRCFSLLITSTLFSKDRTAGISSFPSSALTALQRKTGQGVEKRALFSTHGHVLLHPRQQHSLLIACEAPMGRVIPPLNSFIR